MDRLVKRRMGCRWPEVGTGRLSSVAACAGAEAVNEIPGTLAELVSEWLSLPIIYPEDMLPSASSG